MKPHNLNKVLVIGSGPIIIGQAAEFDYSGTQACKVLKDDGLKVVLVNSNPATIMTDTTIADAVYIEPLTVEFIERIIDKERPDGVICGMGGQIALNLAVELSETGVLAKYNTKLIGTNLESIQKAEDRELFKSTMEKIGQPVIESTIVSNIEAAFKYADTIGYPLVVRPAFTMGGTGGGIVDNPEELMEIATNGLLFSPVNQILLEKCVKGWKEIEYEMMRDNKGNVITVCNMENLDPVGVHTGDSIVVAPSQTLSDKEYQMLRQASIEIVNELDIIGGCNVQIALDPHSFKYYLIEVNPRVSRSSALASKATGYPIAKVAAKIAIGYNLDEIENEVTGKTMACFEPTLDYCVVKIPKWPFDKFESGKRKLGTMMMATGEVMAIGNNFESALLKGIRSLEIKQYGLDYKPSKRHSLQELKDLVVYGDDERLFHVAELIRQGISTIEINELTQIDMFFLEKIRLIVEQEENIKGMDLSEITGEEMLKLKKRGFSDKVIAESMNSNPMAVYDKRKELGITPVYKMVDTCGGEFEAVSNYYYSTYDLVDEVEVSDIKKVIVIGSGPIRIGQGVEFDYCSVHGVIALKNQGIEAIIINNNPETVSTDFDISDKLYFEPITEEDVLNIIDKENPYGVILQYGGQTAIKLAKFLHDRGVRILGTSAQNIDNSENREKFDDLLERCSIARPQGFGVMNMEEGIKAGEELGYPVMVRPSYVLGGAGMEIVYNQVELELYLSDAFKKDKKNPVLIDKYLTGIEIEVDAICDGTDILIPGIMEHLERAGVHSGDSISVYPSYSLSQNVKDKIVEYTERLAKELHVIGLINIQYVLHENEVYVIEVNPRASRTVPYISKVTGISMIEVATQAMLGIPIKTMKYGVGLFPERDIIAVKVPVFSMEKIPNIEIALGPEMRSTGEILSIETDLHKALFKGFISSNMQMPEVGTILASISSNYKDEFVEIAKELYKMGFKFMATAGTKKALEEVGIPSTLACKIGLDGRDVIEVIKSGDVNLVINIPNKGRNARTDGFKIRRASVEKKINCITALDTLNAIVDIKKKNINSADLKIYDICDLTL